MPNIKTKIIEKPYKTHQQKMKNTVIVNKKENCPMNSSCLKESLVDHNTISCNDKNYKPKLHKESCKTNFEKG